MLVVVNINQTAHHEGHSSMVVCYSHFHQPFSPGSPAANDQLPEHFERGLTTCKRAHCFSGHLGPITKNRIQFGFDFAKKLLICFLSRKGRIALQKHVGNRNNAASSRTWPC